MNINPGIFKKTIMFYGASGKKNINGYPEPAKMLFKTKAAVNRMTGKEIATTGTIYSEVTTRFLMRYHAGITTKQYIEYNGGIYDIKYINNYGDSNKYMEIITLKREVSA